MKSIENRLSALEKHLDFGRDNISFTHLTDDELDALIQEACSELSRESGITAEEVMMQIKADMEKRAIRITKGDTKGGASWR